MNEMLALGFLVGLQHALEADHLMAMAALASGGSSLGAVARRGLAWGVGHTATLLALGGTAMLIGSLVPDRLAATLEFAVGLMLVLLGADVLRRLRAQRVHLHPHVHFEPACVQPVHWPVAGLRVHLHAHSHTRPPAAAHEHEHEHEVHEHAHPAAFPLRALCVGMMHGMAGSAAIVVLTLHTVRSPAEGLLYILLFGVGSIVGMGVLGTVIGVPLGWSARIATNAAHGLNALIGCGSAALGLWVMYSTGLVAFPG